MEYYNAYICLNGHPSSYYGDTTNENFCPDCGSEIINICPNCNKPIRGKDICPGFVDCSPYFVPSYCYSCGKPYPWTQLKLDTINELIEFDNGLSIEEKSYITTNIKDLTVDTPKTKVVATKFNVFLQKAGNATVSAIRDILIDVASETAKKIIFPQ